MKFKKKSSLEPAGQIQSNLVEFKFLEIKGRVYFKGEIITKMGEMKCISYLYMDQGYSGERCGPWASFFIKGIPLSKCVI
jgi:hypothetical protein